jgi:hypothetical protein
MLPTDLLALVSNRGRAYRNEAKPFERLGAGNASPNPIETALEPWFSFATGRRAWISARRGRLQGLVSARRRGGRQAWEIDCLIDTTPGLDTLPGLLACAVGEAGRAGAEKIFIRLDAASEHQSIFRAAGFAPYASEALYLKPGPVEEDETPFAIRPMTQQDLYPAFRLYNLVQPDPRRRLEAVTFSEWQACLELRWLKGGVQLVSEDPRQMTALVRAARWPQGLLVDLLVDRSAMVGLGGLIAAAAKATGASRGPCLALVPEQCSLSALLEERGFERQAVYTSLVCRTAQIARLEKLLPKMPRTAVVT